MKRNYINAVAVVLIVIAIAIIYFLFRTVFRPQNELKTVLKAAGKLIVLPQNEQPTLATVSDKTKLLNQPFFADAQNGDKVLIYTNAKKAILYRPSINKIIEVGPVTIASPTAAQKIRVAIYNGTKISGLAASTELQLKEKTNSIEVVSKTNAKGDFSKNLVVDITGKNKNMVQELINIIGGEAATLPAEETKPDADILVILGK